MNKPNISKLKTNDLININQLSTKDSLESIKNKSNWNINNVIDMFVLISGCSSLKSLPDISKWNTDNVTNMSGLFYGCSSLKSLPDIS